MNASADSPFRSVEWAYPSSHPYTIISGPCSAESEDQVWQTALRIKALGIGLYRASLWKPRTRPGGFEGVGHLGIPWLKRVQDELQIQVMTEVATPIHIEALLKSGINSYWIGARTTSSPFAMTELSEALRGVSAQVLVKNPLSPDIDLWEGALMRLAVNHTVQVGAIHRGFSTYGQSQYRNQPLWQIPIELKRRHPNLTLLSDPSHIGGRRDLIESLINFALGMHFDGIIVETHLTPEYALSDSAQQITPHELAVILSRIKAPAADIENDTLRTLRSQVDSLDKRILNLLDERMQLVERIGDYKRSQNLCILQPSRYRELLNERIEWGKRLGLDERLVHELYSAIHEASVLAQQKKA